MTHKFETKRPKEHPPVISITDENEKQQKRITELEAQIAQLTESLETASSAVIVLKQQQREGWAQISSGQEPTGLCVDWLSNVIRQADGNNNLGAGALAEKIVEAVNKLQQAHPKPAQQPLSDRQITSACLSRDHSFGLMDANKRALMIFSAREWERAFAKEKP